MPKFMDFSNKSWRIGMKKNLERPDNRCLQEDLEILANSDIPFKEMENSSILITGATGLVGMNLVLALMCCNRINSTGIKIYALVRDEKKAQDIYKDLLDRKDINIVIGDVTRKICIDDNIDYIIHCASVTKSEIMVKKPVMTIKTSIEGTDNVLSFAVEKSVKSFVYVSSMEMYGSFKIPSFNVTELQIGSINPLDVRSNYPESKRMCENMCIAYLSEYGVPVKIARMAQTFGAGILPGENRVFAQFARSVIENKDIILHTPGKSEGNYCYTRDAVSALLFILLKGINGEAYNVSNEKTHITIAGMASLVASDIANNSIKVIFDIPEENIYGYAAETKMKLNSDKLKELGWKPEVGLKEAYTRLIESMKNCK